jgi:hypothetical protein
MPPAGTAGLGLLQWRARTESVKNLAFERAAVIRLDTRL